MKRWAADERGMVTVWGVLITLVLILVIGITVDLTGQVNAQQRAHDIAQQAARAAANQGQATQAMLQRRTSLISSVSLT